MPPRSAALHEPLALSFDDFIRTGTIRATCGVERLGAPAGDGICT